MKEQGLHVVPAAFPFGRATATYEASDGWTVMVDWALCRRNGHAVGVDYLLRSQSSSIIQIKEGSERRTCLSRKR